MTSTGSNFWRTVVHLFLALVLLATATCASEPPIAPDPVAIEWFVGFGTGAQPAQIEAQQEVVAEFNATHDNIELSLTIGDWSVVYDLLAERIAAGNPPDIIGPIGRQGTGALADQFLDLRPYIDSGVLDVDAYAPAQIEAETGADGRITGLPFGVFPSLLFLSRQAFAEANLPLPPTRFGEQYRGQPWDMEALRDLAIELTLDANGKTAADPEFDPDRIVQWGFHHQFIDDARSIGAFFGPGELVDQNGRATIPEVWVDSWAWYHDLVWTHRAAPNDREMASPVLTFGDPFRSGNIAMAFSHTWYASSMQADGEPLDIFSFAVVPEHEGVATSKLHADTFRVFAQTEHPDEAVEVLRYLLDDAAEDLLTAYSSYPARADLQSGFETELMTLFPGLEGISVVQESLTKPEIPSHEAPLPNFDESQTLLRDFHKLLLTTSDLDLAAEVDQLRSDLEATFASSDS